MLKEASLDNLQFTQNVADGHHQAYRADIAYVLENKATIIKGLVASTSD